MKPTLKESVKAVTDRLSTQDAVLAHKLKAVLNAGYIFLHSRSGGPIKENERSKKESSCSLGSMANKASKNLL